MVNAIINLPYNLKKECIFQKGAILRAISVSFSSFCAFFWGNHALLYGWE